MEVCLLEANGLPEGCLISVRTGSTRRQTAAEAGKSKLLFPQKPKGPTPFKVDFLVPLASTVFEFSPTQDCYPLLANKEGGEDISYTLRLNGAGAGVNLDSKSLTEGPVPVPAIPIQIEQTSRSHRHRQAMGARNYLDEHDILVWVQDLLQKLIQDRPSDPWNYIEKVASGKKQDADRVQREAAKDPVGEDAEGATTASSSLSFKELKAQVRAALAQSLLTGDLQSMLNEEAVAKPMSCNAQGSDAGLKERHEENPVKTKVESGPTASSKSGNVERQRDQESPGNSRLPEQKTIFASPKPAEKPMRAEAKLLMPRLSLGHPSAPALQRLGTGSAKSSTPSGSDRPSSPDLRVRKDQARDMLTSMFAMEAASSAPLPPLGHPAVPSMANAMASSVRQLRPIGAGSASVRSTTSSGSGTNAQLEEDKKLREELGRLLSFTKPTKPSAGLEGMEEKPSNGSLESLSRRSTSLPEINPKRR